MSIEDRHPGRTSPTAFKGNADERVGQMRSIRGYAAVSAGLVSCVVAGAALVPTGVAQAASRGYKIYNESHHHLKLEHARRLPMHLCNSGFCVPTEYPMEFEGRPADGEMLKPKGPPQVWELKYFFGYTYAAAVTYKILGTDGTFEATLETSTFTNNSACKVHPAHLGTCTGQGLKVTFR